MTPQATPGQVPSSSQEDAGHPFVPWAIAWGAGSLAWFRLLWFVATDRRFIGHGSEVGDALTLVAFHSACRADALLSLALESDYKPPLWGLEFAVLTCWRTDLWPGALLLPNLLALPVLLFSVGWTANLLGGRWPCAAAVAFLAGLPGFVGLSTRVGVETTHAALVALALAALVAAGRRMGRGPLAVFAFALGAGQLVKWTFAAYVLPAWVAAATLSTLRSPPGRRIEAMAPWLASAAVGLAPTALWLLGPGELATILAAADDEPRFANPFGWESLSTVPRWLMLDLAPLWLSLPATLWALRGGRGAWAVSPAALPVTVTILAIVGLHTLIPHKEVRYLLPVLGPLAIWWSCAATGGATSRGSSGLGIAIGALLSLRLHLDPPATDGHGVSGPGLVLSPTPTESSDRLFASGDLQGIPQSTIVLDGPFPRAMDASAFRVAFGTRVAPSPRILEVSGSSLEAAVAADATHRLTPTPLPLDVELRLLREGWHPVSRGRFDLGLEGARTLILWARKGER